MEQALPNSVDRKSSYWPLLVLGAVNLLATAARIWVIDHCPEPDTDAKGHLGIAAALLSHPLNVAVHWVWPPGYHYLLAGLLALGVTAHGVRLLNCALAATLPIFVWGYCRDTVDPSAPRFGAHHPVHRRCALRRDAHREPARHVGPARDALRDPRPPDAWAIDTGRFALGGATLAAASLVRYEAWGAVGLLVGLRAVGFVPAVVRRLPAAFARAAACRSSSSSRRSSPSQGGSSHTASPTARGLGSCVSSTGSPTCSARATTRASGAISCGFPSRSRTTSSA